MNSRKGFSLIEAIIAAVILSFAVMVLCGICTRSLTSVRMNLDYEQAWEILDRQLEAISYIGIDDFLEEGETKGDFKGPELTYHWDVETKLTNIDDLYEVKIMVSWKRANKNRAISAATMLVGSEEEFFVQQ